MKLVSGDTMWTKVNKIPNKYTYLSDDIECEVVVVGGGITGALCAYYFTMAGIDTVLLDKNIIGYESTSGSTSILQYEIDYDLIGLSGLIGETKASKAFNLTQQAVYEIKKLVEKLDDDCGFSLRDCFYYSNKESDVSFLKKEYEMRKSNGFYVEFLDKNSGKERFSFPVKAGIYSVGGGGEIDPYRFAHELIKKAVEKGLRVFENTQVIDILSEADKVELKTKNSFNIKANRTIIATGFEARRHIKEKTAILTRSFTLMTKPVHSFEGWHKRCIIRDTNENYTYLRTTSDDRIIIGGEDLGIGGINSKISNLNNYDKVAKEKYTILIDKLKSMFPDIKDIEIEYTFSGVFGETKDGLPYIGEYKDYPNCYFCLGYGSNGILYATLGGKLLKDLYLGKKPEELDLFSFDR